MIETRVFPSSLQVREGPDGRTIVGIAVPYGQPTPINNENGQTRFLEEFGPGGFLGLDQPHELMADHPRTSSELPIGISVVLQERDSGLFGCWRVSNTTFGNDVLNLIKDGAVSGLSIGFNANRDLDEWNEDRSYVRRVGAHLDHTAIVRRPAYAGAGVYAVRANKEPSAAKFGIKMAKDEARRDGRAMAAYIEHRARLIEVQERDHRDWEHVHLPEQAYTALAARLSAGYRMDFTEAS
jgi:HK97 family phage prohead protease